MSSHAAVVETAPTGRKQPRGARHRFVPGQRDQDSRSTIAAVRKPPHPSPPSAHGPVAKHKLRPGRVGSRMHKFGRDARAVLGRSELGESTSAAFGVGRRLRRCWIHAIGEATRLDRSR